MPKTPVSKLNFYPGNHKLSVTELICCKTKKQSETHFEDCQVILVDNQPDYQRGSIAGIICNYNVTRIYTLTTVHSYF